MCCSAATGDTGATSRARCRSRGLRSACQTTVNAGDEDYDPLFPLGFGLTYRDDEDLGVLDETPGPAEGCAE